MNEITRYKLKEMAKKFLTGFGAFLIIAGSITANLFLGSIIQNIQSTVWIEGAWIGIGMVLWFIEIAIIGIGINIVCAIKDSWNKIEVPKILTDEKTQWQEDYEKALKGL